ncbi:MAG: hypothetical protein ACRBCS_10950 [Cellvibrionaceae bacterium]
MTNDNIEDKIKTKQTIAVVASAAILCAGGVYWIIQIGNVMEMLEMAYG